MLVMSPAKRPDYSAVSVRLTVPPDLFKTNHQATTIDNKYSTASVYPSYHKYTVYVNKYYVFELYIPISLYLSQIRLTLAILGGINYFSHTWYILFLPPSLKYATSHTHETTHNT